MVIKSDWDRIKEVMDKICGDPRAVILFKGLVTLRPNNDRLPLDQINYAAYFYDYPVRLMILVEWDTEKCAIYRLTGDNAGSVQNDIQFLTALGQGKPNDNDILRAKIAAMEKEREDTIKTLRAACGDFGDNDWESSLHLSDIIDKHLVDYFR